MIDKIRGTRQKQVCVKLDDNEFAWLKRSAEQHWETFNSIAAYVRWEALQSYYNDPYPDLPDDEACERIKVDIIIEEEKRMRQREEEFLRISNDIR
jgi:hypothetical protein